MKVKVTATVSVEMEIDPEDYNDDETVPKTMDEIIAFELRQAKDDPEDSWLIDHMNYHGKFSDIRIEKVEETASAEVS